MKIIFFQFLLSLLISNCISTTFSAPDANVPVMIQTKSKGSYDITLRSVSEKSWYGKNKAFEIGPKENSSDINNKVKNGFISINSFIIINSNAMFGGWLNVVEINTIGYINSSESDEK